VKWPYEIHFSGIRERCREHRDRIDLYTDVHAWLEANDAT